MRKFDINKLIVLSLFDGIACGYEALLMAGFRNFEYIAAEIERSSIKIASANHPDIKHCGDVRKLRGIDFWMASVILAGSPCQGFSISGKKKGMTMESIMVRSLQQYLQLLKDGYEFKITKKNQSVLFWEFVRLRKEIDEIRLSMGLPPVLFLLENVKMNPFWEMIINDALGECKLLKINSKLLVPQNRERWYWANFEITIPEDKHPKLCNWVEGAVTGIGWSGRRFKETGDDWIPSPSKNKWGIANCITTWAPSKSIPGRAYYTKTGEISDAIPFTIEDLESLQGLKRGYTDVPGVTDDERRKAIGNGWTVPVIAHLLEGLVVYVFGVTSKRIIELFEEYKDEI